MSTDPATCPARGAPTAAASRSDHARHAEAGGFLLSAYEHLGFNFRLTDIQGALGCAQLDRAEFILAQRRLRAAIYDRELPSLGWLRTPYVPPHMKHGYQAYVCLFAPEEPSLANVDALEARRNELMARLEARGITTRQGTHAPVLRAYYRERFGIDASLFPNAVLAEKLSLALPLYPQMTDEEQERVIEALREIGPC